MKKRFLALLMSLCMVLTLLPGLAAAEGEGESGPPADISTEGPESPTPEESPTEEPSPDPADSPIPTNSPEATDSPEPTSSPEATDPPEPTATPTPEPTPTPTGTPTPSPTPTPAVYTVTFDPNGGSVSTKSAATNADGRLSSLPTPTRTGFTFNGWYTKASGGSKISTSTVFDSSATVYAQWTQSKRYTVTFSPNGGSVSTKSATTNADGRLSSLPTPTRSGFTFDGWYTKASGGSRISTSTVFDSNTTVYAQWTVNRYTITFNPNGGSVSTKTASTNTDGNLTSLPTPTRSGYSFDGWYTKANRGSRITSSTVFDSDTTIYAHWYDGETYKDSGSHDLSKLSQKQINSLLADASLTMPETVFSQEPSVSAPYAAGKVTDEALKMALNRLNAMRSIAGLPNVKLDSSLNESAQYGAVLLAASEFSHTPAKPGDMDSNFYSTAKSATSSSNIHYGSGGLYGTLAYSVDGFMDDSDSSNVSALGHRRWQLNPRMGKVGFGFAKKGGAGYVCEKVFDTSGSSVDYEFIAWPASGNFPQSLFQGNTAWSVSLNPELYATPSRSGITVTLTREKDNRTWKFSGSNYTAASSGLYFNVNTTGYGVGNCIIFRPDGVSSYDGVYTVTIDGLRSKSGEDMSLAYQVDFFGADTPPTPTPTVTETAEEAAVREKIEALKSQYPEGMRWTNENSYTSNVSYSVGYGCAGFALLCSDAAFGDAPIARVHSSFDEIKVGDILRINNDTHSVVVLRKLANSVIVTEGNFNSSIHWGREITRASLEEGNMKVTTRWGSAVPEAKPWEAASPWAQEEVEIAITASIVPDFLQSDFTNLITRQEFCALMVRLVERASGQDITSYLTGRGLTVTDPFSDTDDPTVLNAYAMGIVKGTSETTFNPTGSITRQEAATMLTRTGRLLGVAARTGQDFSDKAQFGSWAAEGIAYVSGLTDATSGKRVMEGTGGGAFSPLVTYSREQAILTALRLFRAE